MEESSQPALPENAFRLSVSRQRYWASQARSRSPRGRELVNPIRYARNLQLVRKLKDESYTGLDSGRARNLLELARRADRRGLSGALVDCGVWNGGSSILLGIGAPERAVWAFDSFEGMPKPGPRDPDAHPSWEGMVRGSEEILKMGFSLYAPQPSRLHVVKGWFEKTLPAARDEIGEIAVLHIDADWYESVKLALEVFYEQVVPGGVVAIDDYTTWQGARDATDEFRSRRGITDRMRRGHYWRKR